MLPDRSRETVMQELVAAPERTETCKTADRKTGSIEVVGLEDRWLPFASV